VLSLYKFRGKKFVNVLHLCSQGGGYQQLQLERDGGSSVYFPSEETRSSAASTHHTIVVEATIENDQPNSSDVPGGRLINMPLFSNMADTCRLQ